MNYKICSQKTEANKENNCESHASEAPAISLSPQRARLSLDVMVSDEIQATQQQLGCDDENLVRIVHYWIFHSSSKFFLVLDTHSVATICFFTFSCYIKKYYFDCRMKMLMFPL